VVFVVFCVLGGFFFVFWGFFFFFVVVCFFFFVVLGVCAVFCLPYVAADLFRPKPLEIFLPV